MKNIIYLTLATAIFGSGVLTIDTAYGMQRRMALLQQKKLQAEQSETPTIGQKKAAHPTATPVKEEEQIVKKTVKDDPATMMFITGSFRKGAGMSTTTPAATPAVQQQNAAGDAALSGSDSSSGDEDFFSGNESDSDVTLTDATTDEETDETPATKKAKKGAAKPVKNRGRSLLSDSSSDDEDLFGVAKSQRQPAAKPTGTPVTHVANDTETKQEQNRTAIDIESLLFGSDSEDESQQPAVKPTAAVDLTPSLLGTSSEDYEFSSVVQPITDEDAISQLIKGLKPDSQAGVLTILRADVAMYAIINNITNTQRNKYIAALDFARQLHALLFSHLHDSIYTGDTGKGQTTMVGGFRLPMKAIVSNKDTDDDTPCDLLSWADTKKLFTDGYLKDEDSLNVVLDQIANATQDKCKEVDIENSFRLIRTILEFARYDRGGDEKYNEAVWCDGKDPHSEGGNCCIAEGKNYKDNGLTDDMIRAIVAILERCAAALPPAAK